MSKSLFRFLSIIVITVLLAGCSHAASEPAATLAPASLEIISQAAADAAQPTATLTMPAPAAATSTQPPARATKTPQFKVYKSVSEASAKGTQTPNPYTLSEMGPYNVGTRTFTATDSSRPDRPISITVWYPVKLEAGNTSPYAVPDAAPDRSGAPYPLLLSSTKAARVFAPTLVSHGFTWASIDGIDTYYQTNPEMLHQPLDILFALEQVASNPPPGLEGMIDAEHAGVIGYSFDGYNALALSGARLDPQLYLDLCKDPLQTEQTVSYWFEEGYNCGLARQWESFIAEAGAELTASQDGLWQPVTDARIRAVMPLAADGYYLFGDRGLAEVQVPAMFIVGTTDDLYQENALIYEHLGTKAEDKIFVTIRDRDHVSVIYEPETREILRHFANAFFGYYLQGKEDYADYFSEDFVNQQDGIVWGLFGEN